MLARSLHLPFAGLVLFLQACTEIPSSVGASDPISKESPVEVTLDMRAQDILARMSLEEKVGQVLQADMSAVTPEEIREYNLGAVLNGGNSAPGGGKVASPQAWIDLADAYWLASTDKSDGGVGVPLLWGTDAVHGHNNLQNATIFPHNVGLGATRDPELIREIGEVTAREVRATGIEWTFAPTLAVARDDRWGRGYESYSEDPGIVAKFAAPFVEGLQGRAGHEEFLSGDRVLATAKHFLGDGGTQDGVDRGDTVGEVSDVFRTHGAGYGPAIDAGVQTVMASFSSVNGEKIHGSKYWLTDILRGELGFEGFTVGDWDGHSELPGCTNVDCPDAILAGLDMYMAPDSWKGLHASLIEQVLAGEVPEARLDEAVLRILRVKLQMGLFEAGPPSARAATKPDLLGAPAHRDVARRAVRQSLVLLKNEDQTLPIQPKNTRVLVTGSGADSMEQQTGGWTLNWQGTGNANDEFETGETIYSGIERAVASAGGEAFLVSSLPETVEADIAIVVFGETPYAEYRGDRTDVVFEFEDGENLAALNALKAQGIPTVSVFITGRPLWTNPHLNASDAFVVAWLPGSEGGGIADLLISSEDGSPRHDFSGKLSFTWPSDGRGARVNDPAEDERVLFPLGYGLTYGADVSLETLSEVPGVLPPTFNGAVVSRGEAQHPFSFYLGDLTYPRTRVIALEGASITGAVTTRGIDYRAQEDSRIFEWSGEDTAFAYVESDRPISLDLVGAVDTLVLELEWRVDAPPSESFLLGLGCGEGCVGLFDITDHLNEIAGMGWMQSRFPVHCFVGEGLDLERFTSPLGMTTSGTATVALHAARIKTVDDQALAQACPILDHSEL